MNRANGKLDFSHAEWLAVFSEVLDEFKRELAAKGESHKFIGARVKLSAFTEERYFLSASTNRLSTRHFDFVMTKAWLGALVIASK